MKTFGYLPMAAGLFAFLSACGSVAPPPNVGADGSAALSSTAPWKTVSSDVSSPDRLTDAPVHRQPTLNALTLGSAIPHQGNAPKRFPDPSSTTVVTDTEGTVDTYTSGVISVPINVHRYVGNVSSAIQAGTLSAKTTITFPMFDIDERASGCAEIDVAYFNGTRLGQLHGDNNLWQTQNFTVDSTLVHFPATPGATASNTLEVRVDTLGCNQWYTEVDWAALQFQAAPVIVMVHGINSNGGTWAAFAQQLNSQGFVADNSITLPYPALNTALLTNPGNACENTAFDSVGRNSRLLKQAFRSIAEKYGTSELNILGHSKGGMDSKAAIAGLHANPPLIQVNSMGGTPVEAKLKISGLVALNSPQMGTVAADLGVAAVLERNGEAANGTYDQLLGKTANFADRFLRGKITGILLQGDYVCDLTTWKGRAINDRYPISVPAFGSVTDASSSPNDPDHGLTVSDANNFGSDFSGVARNTIQLLYRYVGSTGRLDYRLVGTAPVTYEVTLVRKDWAFNDILVTAQSAKGPGYPMAIDGLAGINHSEAQNDLATQVIFTAKNGYAGVQWKLK